MEHAIKMSFKKKIRANKEYGYNNDNLVKWWYHKNACQRHTCPYLPAHFVTTVDMVMARRFIYVCTDKCFNIL